jgi:protein involved in polysaccharide export with SLBB domain
MNNFKHYLSIITVFLCFFTHNPVSAQSLPTNFSTMNVDELSDAQVQQLIQQAQASGLSDVQLIQTAQSKGMSSAQVQHLQLRIADIRKKSGDNSNSSVTTPLSTRESSLGTIQVEQQNQKVANKDVRSKIFGANLFRNSTANTFEPNLKIATPVNYILGTDDQLQVNVYGNSVATWNLPVSPEGNINIPGIGILNVAGRTVEQATSAIKTKLIAGNYAIGRGTSVQVTLGNIRSIKVILQGEVVKPGTYTLSSLSTVFNALYAAGGPGDIGSFRRIEVIRNNRIVRHLDLYDFLVKDQDIIRVPTYNIRVELNGEVKIPAVFETLPGEILQDVINFAGGFTDQAYTARIKVIQVNDQQHYITDIVENDYKNYTPLRGDKYTVDKILDRYENRVTIKGAIFRPGDFELQKGLTISKLIKNAV